jgi:hypothetical protein
MEFKQPEDVDTHLNSEQICDKSPASERGQTTVLTEAQMRELKKRKGEVNEEEQWKGMYKIIFPDEEIIPSPCQFTLL